MPRPKAITPEQERELRALQLDGELDTPARVHRHLVEKGLIQDYGEGAFSVSVKTIARWMHKNAPPDPSGPWSFAGADSPEARAVIDVLATVFDITEGRVWLTIDLASRVARVRAAVPDIPPTWAYGIARAYQSSEAEGLDVRSLDLLLGARPWESRERADWFASLVEKSRPTAASLNALRALEKALTELQRRATVAIQVPQTAAIAEALPPRVVTTFAVPTATATSTALDPTLLVGGKPME